MNTLDTVGKGDVVFRACHPILECAGEILIFSARLDTPSTPRLILSKEKRREEDEVQESQKSELLCTKYQRPNAKPCVMIT